MMWGTEESSQILNSFLIGNIDGEECFGLILSLEGYEPTRCQFLTNIADLKLTHPQKFQSLHDSFTSYFKKEPSTNFTAPIEASVENGYLTSDFDYELDMELALSQSLSKQTQNLSESIKTGGVMHSVGMSSYNGSYSNTRNLGKEFSYISIDSETAKVPQRPSTGDLKPVAQTLAVPQEISSELIPQKRKSKGRKSKSGIHRSLSSKPVIYWFRRDLRLHDNPALNAAVEYGGPVIFTFLWTEEEEDPNNFLAVGGATKLWLHHALKSLCSDLVEKYGHGIVYRKTDNTISEMKKLIEETDAKSVIINNVYEPFLCQRDDKLCKVLSDRGVTCQRFDSYLLHRPSDINSSSIWKRGVGSVTHFMESCRVSNTKSVGHVLEAPHICPRVATIPMRHKLDELGLARMPCKKDGTTIDWAAPIREQWDFGESGAWHALELFLEEGNCLSSTHYCDNFFCVCGFCLIFF